MKVLAKRIYFHDFQSNLKRDAKHEDNTIKIMELTHKDKGGRSKIIKVSKQRIEIKT